MRPSLYLETTILGYLTTDIRKDILTAGRQIATQEFWELERHNYELFVSDYVYEECARGNKTFAAQRLSLLDGIAVLDETPEVKTLAETYVRILSIPPKATTDAYHLAICCIHGIDILLSWNFKHLGARSMQIVQRYNDANGLPTPQMVAPDALINYKEGDFDE